MRWRGRLARPLGCTASEIDGQDGSPRLCKQRTPVFVGAQRIRSNATRISCNKGKKLVRDRVRAMLEKLKQVSSEALFLLADIAPILSFLRRGDDPSGGSSGLPRLEMKQGIHCFLLEKEVDNNIMHQLAKIFSSHHPSLVTAFHRDDATPQDSSRLRLCVQESKVFHSHSQEGCVGFSPQLNYNSSAILPKNRISPSFDLLHLRSNQYTCCRLSVRYIV